MDKPDIEFICTEPLFRPYITVPGARKNKIADVNPQYPKIVVNKFEAIQIV